MIYSSSPQQSSNHCFTQADRDRLAIRVYYTVEDQRSAMKLDEAVSWASDRADLWFGTRIADNGIQNLYRQGKRQRSRA